MKTPGIGVKLSNAFSQFLRGHRVFVMHPPEGLLVKVNAIVLRFLRLCGIEHTVNDSLGLLQLVEEFRADGEQVRPGQAHDLIHVAKACAHHLSHVRTS